MKHKIGVTFGCYIPLHSGHINIIRNMLRHHSENIIGVTGYDMDRGRDFVPFLRRVKLVNEIFGTTPGVQVIEVDDKKLGLTGTFSLEAWATWCDYLFRNAAGIDPDDKNCEFHWYIGDAPYIEKIRQLYPTHIFHQMDRSLIPVSGTSIRSNPAANLEHIHPAYIRYLRTNGILKESE